MEILIAVIALSVGFIICFLIMLGRNGGKKRDEMANALYEEREAAVKRENEQRLETQKLLWETKIGEQEKVFRKELELKDGFIAEQKLSFDRERQSLNEAFNERLKEQERHYKELAASMEEAHKGSLEALKAKFNETINTMSEQLKTVTGEMLRQRQEEFAENSKERLDQLLHPLQFTITEMRKAVAENTNKHSELGGQLDAGLKTLMNHTAAAQASADKLASALRGNNRVQGEWGETVLRELLESQGLKEGTHFDVQSVISNADGSQIRPDVILHLDQGREVIIDSKVSLSAFMDYINTDSDEAKTVAIRDHIASIQRHVDELSRKDYTSYIKAPKTKIDYVIMFVPNTSALLLATANNPDLWRKAMEKNVYIADEQTLYAALRIISMTWTHIAQVQNHERVFELAEEMMDRVGQFMKHYQEMGKKIEGAAKSYEDGLKKLSEGKQSIPGTCGKLIKLGAKQTKNSRLIPPEMLEIEEREDD